MIDASRLDLEGNASARREVAGRLAAHEAGFLRESEQGGDGPRKRPGIPYEEIFATRRIYRCGGGRAFRTGKKADATGFQSRWEYPCRAVAENLRHQKKPEARLDIEHLEKCRSDGNPACAARRQRINVSVKASGQVSQKSTCRLRKSGRRMKGAGKGWTGYRGGAAGGV